MIQARATDHAPRLPLATGAGLGVLIGLGFGAYTILSTWLDPFSDDTVAAVLSFYLPMFTLWGVAGFAAGRRSGRLLHAVQFGALVAFVTFTIFHFAVMLRVNLFLDQIAVREDWGTLVYDYSQSGFHSLRAYANYVYVTGAPFKIFVATAIGAVFGLIGGLFALPFFAIRSADPSTR